MSRETKATDAAMGAEQADHEVVRKLVHEAMLTADEAGGFVSSGAQFWHLAQRMIALNITSAQFNQIIEGLKAEETTIVGSAGEADQFSSTYSQEQWACFDVNAGAYLPDVLDLSQKMSQKSTPRDAIIFLKRKLNEMPKHMSIVIPRPQLFNLIRLINRC